MVFKCTLTISSVPHFRQHELLCSKRHSGNVIFISTHFLSLLIFVSSVLIPHFSLAITSSFTIFVVFIICNMYAMREDLERQRNRKSR